MAIQMCVADLILVNLCVCNELHGLWLTTVMLKIILMSWHENTWWRHQMETLSALLGLCAGYSPVPGELSTQRPVTQSFDVFFDLSLNKRLSRQLNGWWFETPSCSLWRHSNDFPYYWPFMNPLVTGTSSSQWTNDVEFWSFLFCYPEC